MKEVFLYRDKSSDEGTFGFLTYLGNYWHSLELPDRDNERDLSSIQLGKYKCTLRYSPRFKRHTYLVTNVEGRDYILIHSANFAGDIKLGLQSHLNGCIALGKSKGIIKNKFGKNQRAVLTSRFAVNEFMSFMDGEDFILNIEELC